MATLSISPADEKRVKAMGFLSNKGTDNFSARIITVNGKITAKQNQCIAEAAEKNIKFTYEIEWVGNLAIQDIDMCALLANLLDNAIEACEKIEDESRWIHLKIRRKSEMLLILLENSIVESKKDKESFFVTTKKNKIYHGLGLKSIENVVQKYEGYIDCIIYKEKVQFYISLPVE